MKVRFRMSKINTEQFAILREEAPSQDSKVTMETSLYFKAATNAERLAADVRFSFMEEKSPFLVIEVSCEFGIHQEDWTAMSDGENITVPKETLEYLAVHTIGTARGILHCKTEGTAFNRFIIPPVNVAAMIGGDLAISVSNGEGTSEPGQP